MEHRRHRREGARARIVGAAASQGRPELDGQEAVLVAWRAEQGGWEVRVGAGGEALCLPPAQLEWLDEPTAQQRSRLDAEAERRRKITSDALDVVLGTQTMPGGPLGQWAGSDENSDGVRAILQTYLRYFPSSDSARAGAAPRADRSREASSRRRVRAGIAAC